MRGFWQEVLYKYHDMPGPTGESILNSNNTSDKFLQVLNDAGSFRAEAIYIGQRLKWSTELPWPVLNANPLTIGIGDSGCAVLFRYGVVVIFNLSQTLSQQFLQQLQHMVSEPLPVIEMERVSIRVDAGAREGADFENLLLRQVDLPRLQVIADVLAKSTIMAYYEPKVAQQFERIEPLAAELHLGWRASRRSKELLKHIGETLVMESKMIGRAEVVEKPELLWEYPELDRLYVRLEDEYELQERYEALERKLGLITRTAETQLSLLHHRSGLRVEWYIVILIVFEIIITLLVK
jgi:uncharacterized Rmd1/YagE family protein